MVETLALFDLKYNYLYRNCRIDENRRVLMAKLLNVDHDELWITVG